MVFGYDLTLCEQRIKRLREMYDEHERRSAELATQVEELSSRVVTKIESQDVVISVEEVQDLFGRHGRPH